MILGLGSDLCDIRRIERALERFGDRFIQRVFTPVEIAKAERRPGTSRTGTYAKRFAAKEAVAKAFRTGIGDAAAFREVEVVVEAHGAPIIHLHGAAAATSVALGITGLALSLTHTERYAAAMVVATRNPG
jgi:holo-[acyl-carrier protein] synthase